MTRVRVTIEGKDRNVGAMVKALAVEVSGYESVKGATKEFLAANGFYEFRFPNDLRATDFQRTVRKYLPEQYARVNSDS